MYLKVEGTGGGSAGSGIGRIEVYDLNGQLVPLTKADVISTNVNQRTGDANYLYLFQKGSSANPPPYGPAAGIYYVIKLPEGLKGFSKIYLMMWTNTSYNVTDISISTSKDNQTYEEIYQGNHPVSDQRDVLQGYSLSTDSILLRIYNKVYSLNTIELIEIPNISINVFEEYGVSPDQNLNRIFSIKSYILQDVAETQLTKKPLSLTIR